LVRYASNALRPSSVKVSKVDLRMLLLLRSDPLLPEFPPFTLDVLEVVDSPAESIGAERTYTKQEKPEHVVWQTELSGFVDSDGSQGHRRHLTREPLL
jgi:hypothetical protein